MNRPTIRLGRFGGRVSRDDGEILIDVERLRISRAGVALKFSRRHGAAPSTFRAAVALLVTPHEWTPSDIAEAVFFDDPQGGPLNPRDRADQLISRLRRPLRAIGVELGRVVPYARRLTTKFG